MSRVEQRAPATFTNTVDIQGNSRIMYTAPVIQTDANETLTADLNAGRTTIIPNVDSADKTYTLPTPVAGMRLHIVGFGNLAADGHDVIIKGTDETHFLHGAVIHHSTNNTGQTSAVVWGNGTSDDVLKLALPEAFDLHFLAKSSTVWYVWGWTAAVGPASGGDGLTISDA